MGAPTRYPRHTHADSIPRSRTNLCRKVTALTRHYNITLWFTSVLPKIIGAQKVLNETARQQPQKQRKNNTTSHTINII